MGGRTRESDEKLPRVPLCREHHDRQHADDRETIELLIAKAPMYWKETDQWGNAQKLCETWVARRLYRLKTKCGSTPKPLE